MVLAWDRTRVRALAGPGPAGSGTAPSGTAPSVRPGRYALMVGDSSASLPLIAHVNLGGNG